MRVNLSKSKIFWQEILFIGLFGLTVIGVGFLSIITIGPTIEGLGCAFLPLIVAFPTALILFDYLLHHEKIKALMRYGLPLLILPGLFSMIWAFTMFIERNPENMFRVFVCDPVPPGISNIKGSDESAGIDMDIVMSFNITPTGLDKILTKNNLSLGGQGSYLNDEFLKDFYPDGDKSQKWTEFDYGTKDYHMSLWINPDATLALVHYNTY